MDKISCKKSVKDPFNVLPKEDKKTTMKQVTKEPSGSGSTKSIRTPEESRKGSVIPVRINNENHTVMTIQERKQLLLKSAEKVIEKKKPEEPKYVTDNLVQNWNEKNSNKGKEPRVTLNIASPKRCVKSIKMDSLDKQEKSFEDSNSSMEKSMEMKKENECLLLEIDPNHQCIVRKKTQSNIIGRNETEENTRMKNEKAELDEKEREKDEAIQKRIFEVHAHNQKCLKRYETKTEEESVDAMNLNVDNKKTSIPENRDSQKLGDKIIADSIETLKNCESKQVTEVVVVEPTQKYKCLIHRDSQGEYQMIRKDIFEDDKPERAYPEYLDTESSVMTNEIEEIPKPIKAKTEKITKEQLSECLDNLSWVNNMEKQTEQDGNDSKVKRPDLMISGFSAGLLSDVENAKIAQSFLGIDDAKYDEIFAAAMIAHAKAKELYYDSSPLEGEDSPRRPKKREHRNVSDDRKHSDGDASPVKRKSGTKKTSPLSQEKTKGKEIHKVDAKSKSTEDKEKEQTVEEPPNVEMEDPKKKLEEEERQTSNINTTKQPKIEESANLGKDPFYWTSSQVTTFSSLVTNVDMFTRAAVAMVRAEKQPVIPNIKFKIPEPLQFEPILPENIRLQYEQRGYLDPNLPVQPYPTSKPSPEAPNDKSSQADEPKENMDTNDKTSSRVEESKEDMETNDNTSSRIEESKEDNTEVEESKEDMDTSTDQCDPDSTVTLVEDMKELVRRVQNEPTTLDDETNKTIQGIMGYYCKMNSLDWMKKPPQYTEMLPDEDYSEVVPDVQDEPKDTEILPKRRGGIVYPEEPPVLHDHVHDHEHDHHHEPEPEPEPEPEAESTPAAPEEIESQEDKEPRSESESPTDPEPTPAPQSTPEPEENQTEPVSEQQPNSDALLAPEDITMGNKSTTGPSKTPRFTIGSDDEFTENTENPASLPIIQVLSGASPSSHQLPVPDDQEVRPVPLPIGPNPEPREPREEEQEAPPRAQGCIESTNQTDELFDVVAHSTDQSSPRHFEQVVENKKLEGKTGRTSTSSEDSNGSEKSKRSGNEVVLEVLCENRRRTKSLNVPAERTFRPIYNPETNNEFAELFMEDNPERVKGEEVDKSKATPMTEPRNPNEEPMEDVRVPEVAARASEMNIVTADHPADGIVTCTRGSGGKNKKKSEAPRTPNRALRSSSKNTPSPSASKKARTSNSGDGDGRNPKKPSKNTKNVPADAEEEDDKDEDEDSNMPELEKEGEIEEIKRKDEEGPLKKGEQGDNKAAQQLAPKPEPVPVPVPVPEHVVNPGPLSSPSARHPIISSILNSPPAFLRDAQNPLANLAPSSAQMKLNLREPPRSVQPVQAADSSSGKRKAGTPEVSESVPAKLAAREDESGRRVSDAGEGPSGAGAGRPEPEVQHGQPARIRQRRNALPDESDSSDQGRRGSSFSESGISGVDDTPEENESNDLPEEVIPGPQLEEIRRKMQESIREEYGGNVRQVYEDSSSSTEPTSTEPSASLNRIEPQFDSSSTHSTIVPKDTSSSAKSSVRTLSSHSNEDLDEPFATSSPPLPQQQNLNLPDDAEYEQETFYYTRREGPDPSVQLFEMIPLPQTEKRKRTTPTDEAEPKKIKTEDEQQAGPSRVHREEARMDDPVSDSDAEVASIMASQLHNDPSLNTQPESTCRPTRRLTYLLPSNHQDSTLVLIHPRQNRPPIPVETRPSQSTSTAASVSEDTCSSSTCENQPSTTEKKDSSKGKKGGKKKSGRDTSSESPRKSKRLSDKGPHQK